MTALDFKSEINKSDFLWENQYMSKKERKKEWAIKNHFPTSLKAT